MRKTSLLLVLVTFCWLLGVADAQENPITITFSRQKRFNIPFSPLTQKLRSLRLYVSTDQGRTWQLQTTALPEQGKFSVTVERDGFYWFTVQTIDMDNRPFPTTLEGAQPNIKVVVDTVPPSVTLRPLPPRGGEVGVSWEINDENPDLALPDAVRLEYRTAGSAEWRQIAVSASARQHYWNPQTVSLVEVRLSARDRAGNLGEATTTVGINGNNAPAVQPDLPPNPGVGFGAEIERKFVNSTRISLNYELKDVGPSGVSQVELWYTLDGGRTWRAYDELKFGSDPNQKNVTFDVKGEGLYGLSLIARSGVGLGEKPPQPGDRPQMLIEVDTTKPVVQLHNVLVGQGIDKGKVTVTWSARDKNLEREPITLSYARDMAGPWTTIADKLANTGRYVWVLPPDIPYQFYVRVEAIDRARNIESAASPELIRVDLSIPRAKISSVEPAGK